MYQFWSTHFDYYTHNRDILTGWTLDPTTESCPSSSKEVVHANTFFYVGLAAGLFFVLATYKVAINDEYTLYKRVQQLSGLERHSDIWIVVGFESPQMHMSFLRMAN